MESNAADSNANPGYDLFNSDSEDDPESIPDEIILPSSDNEDDPVLEHTNISSNDLPLPSLPNRGLLNPTSNWLQSSSENDSNPDHDQFLLNAEDMFSDDAWSSCSSQDVLEHNNIGQNGFDFNDEYIDDDLYDNNNTDNPVP